MPDGDDFTFDIECRIDPRAGGGEPHEVTIHHDWSITTDLLRGFRTAVSFDFLRCRGRLLVSVVDVVGNLVAE